MIRWVRKRVTDIYLDLPSQTVVWVHGTTWVHGTQRQDYCLMSMTKKKEQGQAVKINNLQVEVSVTQLQSQIRRCLMVMAVSNTHLQIVPPSTYFLSKY